MGLHFSKSWLKSLKKIDVNYPDIFINGCCFCGFGHPKEDCPRDTEHRYLLRIHGLLDQKHYGFEYKGFNISIDWDFESDEARWKVTAKKDTDYFFIAFHHTGTTLKIMKKHTKDFIDGIEAIKQSNE